MHDEEMPQSLRVLHITNWYPSKEKPLEGIWIKKVIESLPKSIKSQVVHLRVQPNDMFGINRTIGIPGYIVNVAWENWLLIELLTFVLLVYMLLFKVKLSRYDVINFHIAYPLCVFLDVVQIFIKKPIIINEHWSAYHLNFGVKKPDRLGRIRRIFKPDRTFITVSRALATDIARFSNQSHLKVFVVPNVVDTDLFKYNSRPSTGGFFMASTWKFPKDPILVLEAIKNLRTRYADLRIRIAGDGPLLDTMLKYIHNHNLQGIVTCLGRMDSAQLAYEMQCAIAFIHISQYETFSVVCAESICCGTPVIASAVGGIPEFIDQNNGYLLSSNDLVSVERAMEGVILGGQFERESIAYKAASLFNKETVGSLYRNAILNGCGIT